MKTFKLNSNWLAARANSVSQTGVQLTTSDFPSVDREGWMGAVVPGTILATLLKNNLIPDPFYGMQNENIEDIGEAGRDFYTFWFCTSFKPPEFRYSQAWLKFRGVNYSADVYVNGHKASLGKGMFRRHELDITDWVERRKENYLAVCVYPPDHPGQIPKEGGQGGDHDIGKDVAAQYVEGWDWMTPIRDRNTGLWDEVSLSFTGPVTIRDPHLVTTLYDDYKRAHLDVSTELVNSSSEDAKCTVHVHVYLDLEEDLSSVEHVVSAQLSIEAGASKVYTFPQLAFHRPHLWWPNGMGKHPLYKVDISVGVGEKEDSDEWSHRIGFRHISSHVDDATGGRLFEINGKPLFIRGGNWIVSDGLLRLSKERYKTDVGFHADMNFNMIRIWGGALAERPAFYDVCDERGLLVWQEFWITGDCDGRSDTFSDRKWPLDHELFLDCARDTVRLLRNHASLALWVGGNEQYPAHDINDTLTRELVLNPTYEGQCEGCEIKRSRIDVTKYLDGTRSYIKGSLWCGFADSKGGFTDGPYGIQNPEDFFKDDFYPYGFNPEIGSVGVPVAATIREMMPQEAWKFPEVIDAEDGYVDEVPNPTWDYHKYIPYADSKAKVRHQIASYGKPKDLDDFCEKAQIVNYVQYRALIESWNSRMWDKYTGVLIWKTQNPWHGLRGGLYDFLHDQTGGFFGIKSAAEPVHIQLNLSTHIVEIVNTTMEPLKDLYVEASLWELNCTSPCWTKYERLSSPPFKTLKRFKVSYPTDGSSEDVYFVLLKLVTHCGAVISRNFYWLHVPGSDYSSLEGDFQARKVPIHVSAKASREGSMLHITAKVRNILSQQTGNKSGPGVAFWLHFFVLQGDTEKRILPVNYSNNFFSLVPGEQEPVTISFEVKKGVTPKVFLQGWNIDKVELPCHQCDK